MIELQYIPDVNQLIDVYLDAVDNAFTEEWGENPYFTFLKQHGFLTIDDGQICKSELYDFSSKKNAYKSIAGFLKDWNPSKHVIDRLSIGVDNLAELEKELKDNMTPDSLRVILAWMEQIGLVNNSGAGYILNDNFFSIDEENSSIYPLKYEKSLDISEDKYSVFEYLRKIKQGKIDIKPDFQRNEVWNEFQKSRFIESTILNIPIPPLYLKKTNDARLVIVDGLQRTSTLMEFTENKFRLVGLEALNFLNGKTFQDLRNDESGYATRIEDKQLYVYILGTNVSMPWVYDIFNRINTGGTKLERQEIRNCVYIGKSTVLLKFLANSETFKMSVDKGISDKRMKAREAILRCLSFVLFEVEDYKGSIDQMLENTMKKINGMNSDEVENLKKQTLRTFDITQRLFGPINFRIPNEFSRGRINVAVMETVFNCFWNQTECVLKEKDILLSRYNQLVSDKNFLDSFKTSTSLKSGVEKRFELAHKYLD